MTKTLAALCLLGARPLVAQVPDLAPQPQAAAPETSGAKLWIGRYAELEAYLRTAAIEHVEDVPIGVTKPKRAFFVPGGPVRSATFKQLPMGRRTGYWEAHQSEVAAYELDRLLGLDMVPVTVERKVGSELASVLLWIEGCRRVRPWVLGDGTVRQILKRRDKIVAHFERLAREQGESVVFPF